MVRDAKRSGVPQVPRSSDKIVMRLNGGRSVQVEPEGAPNCRRFN
jgi:hypothetical protein